jgi:hypothetical protein
MTTIVVTLVSLAVGFVLGRIGYGIEIPIPWGRLTQEEIDRM